MNKNTLRPTACRKFGHGNEVAFMAVDTTGGEQANQVYRPAIGDSFVNRLGEVVINIQVTVFNRLADTGKVLINDTSGTNIHMANFRVAHLTFGEPHVKAIGVNEGVRAAFPQFIHCRRMGSGHRIMVALGVVAVAVENNQRHGARGARSIHKKTSLRLASRTTRKFGVATGARLGHHNAGNCQAS